MLRGALAFRRLLGRWIELERAGAPSEPFVYAVHRDSLLSPARVREHVAAVGSLLGATLAESGGDYLGARRALDGLTDLLEDVAVIPGLFRQQRRVGRNTVDDAERHEILDVLEVAGVDEELHGFLFLIEA